MTEQLIDLSKIDFWLACLTAVFVLAPLTRGVPRKWARAAVNIGFIALLLRWEALGVLGAVTVAYLLLQAMAGERYRGLCVALAGLGVLGLFIANKLPEVTRELGLAPLRSTLSVIGFSYVALRMVDVIRAVLEGSLRPPDFPSTINYLLPFFRLAPVQCTSLGVPGTSGIPQMDYYLSSELLETEEAAEHYTEKLVQLTTLPTYYYRPSLPPELKTRGHFGLANDRHIYLCPQNLLKFHPEFDHSVGEILRRDPRGDVVLIEGPHPHWAELLLDRFRATIPDGVERIRFLPHQSRPDFLNLMVLSDVLLDPFHFGGGNTTYEALALGTPIVTLPSAYLRGRVSFACYQKMGVLDCVASDPQDYVSMAVRLGTDPEYRDTIRSKVLSTSDVLFEDIEAVRQFERFIQHAVQLRRENAEVSS